MVGNLELADCILVHRASQMAGANQKAVFKIIYRQAWLDTLFLGNRNLNILTTLGLLLQI